MAISRDQFSRVAEQFAKSKVHSDKQFLETIVQLASPSPNGAVLDVATGTGYVAAEFARRTGGVTVGTDITGEMLKWARKVSTTEHVNAAFIVAEAAHQPFPDETFGTVASRLAIHHIENPLAVVKEMRRVCKPGGRVVIADQISPEEEDAARFHDEFEKFRDPSHQRALRVSEFRDLFKTARLSLAEPGFVPVTLALDEWADRAGCDADKTRELRRMLNQAPSRFRDAFSIRELDGHLYFDLQRVVLVGRR